MAKSKEIKKFEQVVQRIEPQRKLLRAWALKGGVSAQVTVLEVEQLDGQTRKMVIRQHGDRDLKQNPQVAADEFKLLEITQSAGLATPIPYFVDQSCEIFSTPYLVVEYIEGETEFAPSNLDDFIYQFTSQLIKIHRVDRSNLSFLPNYETRLTEKLSERPEELDESIDEGRIRETLESVWPIPQRNESVLLHGDYWPGNVLWKDEKLVGVIDWEDAKLGDPLADLANSRLEILWAFGIEAMHGFTQQYQSMTSIDLANLPYWDLWAALKPAFRLAEWAGDVITEKKMLEGHRWFTAQAFEKLAL